MNWMKPLTALALSACVVAGGAWAQKPAAPKRSTATVGRPGAGPGANPLNLTPAQLEKIRAMNEKMMPEVQAAFASAKTDAERRKKLEALTLKWRPKMMSILTPAQRKKADAMEKEGRARAKAMMMKQNAAPKKAR